MSPSELHSKVEAEAYKLTDAATKSLWSTAGCDASYELVHEIIRNAVYSGCVIVQDDEISWHKKQKAKYKSLNQGLLPWLLRRFAPASCKAASYD